MERQPLEIGAYRRWLVITSSGRLHRIAEILWEDGGEVSGPGFAVCGRGGRFSIPGIYSRVHLPRCKECCRLAGVPEGDGAPVNSVVDG